MGEPARDPAGEPERERAGEPDLEPAGEPDRERAGEADGDLIGEPERDRTGEPDRDLAGDPEPERAGDAGGDPDLDRDLRELATEGDLEPLFTGLELRTDALDAARELAFEAGLPDRDLLLADEALLERGLVPFQLPPSSPSEALSASVMVMVYRSALHLERINTCLLI